MRSIILTIFLIFNLTKGFTSSICYPWILKLNDNVTIKSTPFRQYDYCQPGETKVFKNGKNLYTIDEYFSDGYNLTDSTGEILIRIFFSIYHADSHVRKVDEKGNQIKEGYHGDAIRFYKNGQLDKTIDFNKILIDTTKIGFVGYSRDFVWGRVTTPTYNNIQAYIKNKNLIIHTIDNQKLIISLSDYKISLEPIDNNYQSFLNTLSIKRKLKVIKRGLPKKDILPQFKNGKAIQEGLSEFLKLNSSERKEDSAILRIYIHTLLIDKNGECTYCYLSPTYRESSNTDFGDDYDKVLKDKIEIWLKEQKYKTNKIPRYTDKYSFIGFLFFEANN